MNKGNEPAFPVANGRFYQAGLTKREYYAGLPMQGMVADGWNILTDKNTKEMAQKAYKIADEMIEVNKEGK